MSLQSWENALFLSSRSTSDILDDRLGWFCRHSRDCSLVLEKQIFVGGLPRSFNVVCFRLRMSALSLRSKKTTSGSSWTRTRGSSTSRSRRMDKKSTSKQHFFCLFLAAAVFSTIKLIRTCRIPVTS